MRQLKITKQITNRENRSLDRYLLEISQKPMITADEEVELAQRIREGDEVALKRMVDANLRFVVSVAKQYQNQGLTLGDLINEGNLGLIKAAQRFDETRGFKFISYAVWWIRQSILQAIADQARLIRLPLNKVGALSKIMQVWAELEQKLERDPTPAEIAERSEMHVDTVIDILKHQGKAISLDVPMLNGDPDSDSLLAILGQNDEPNPDSHITEEGLREEISVMLSKLPEKERKILKYFYGLDGYPELSMEDVSEAVGLSRERCRQLNKKTLKWLKKSARGEILKTYL
jgi:RNA polymerase primary sigma factor